MEQESVDALGHAFTEYYIILADDAQTLHITPFSYRVLDSYNDVMRIAMRIGAQPIAVYDTTQAVNALVMRLRVLLLLVCFAVEIILGRCLWCYTKYSIRKIHQGLMQYYPGELMKWERKSLIFSALILLIGLVVMVALWSLSVFEPVWPPQNTGILLNDIWTTVFPPVTANSTLEKLRLAGDVLLASGIALTVGGFVLWMIGWVRYEDSTY
jgi:hypothetical protein